MAFAVGFLVTPVTIIVKMIHNQLVDKKMNEWRTMQCRRDTGGTSPSLLHELLRKPFHCVLYIIM